MKDLRNAAYSANFSTRPQWVFSAPGRSELSGNHTDHQHGCVLACAVNLDMIATVGKNADGVVRVLSEGYPLCEIPLNDLGKKEDELGTTASLIRGICAKFESLGCKLGGFDAYVTSTVLPGSGLSSSAAFEVLIGTILNHLFFEKQLSAVRIAQIGQWSENVYFGKPCGLMDQTASSVGSIIAIDFADPNEPIVERLSFDFAACRHALCIIDSGADHADLTDEYASIPTELRAVCAVFGKQYLREVDENAFYARIAEARAAAGDRAVLRAIHIFEENKRVRQQIDALRQNDFDSFLQLVNESGRSSWDYLQNVIPTGQSSHQEMAFALALCKRLLNGRGACRVHGGGFAGTVLAFVPLDMLEPFRAEIDAVLGEGHCQVLSIRAEGGICLEEYHD